MEKARLLMPNLPDVHNNLANVLEALGEAGSSKEMFQKAIQLRPEYPEAHHSLSQVFLRERDFETGWELYRWRHKKKEHDHRNYAHPPGMASRAMTRHCSSFRNRELAMSSCLPPACETCRSR